MKRLSEQSLYEILEVPPDAKTAEIESAYTRARELYGPGSLATYSLMAPEDASAFAERIEEAKRVLLDPDARARYDAALTAATHATEAAVRIAATGSGAVASGPQRSFLATPPPARTPAPRAPTSPATSGAPVEAAQRAGDPPPQAPGPLQLVTAARAPAPIRLEKEVPDEQPSRELVLPEGAAWTGEALRRARESRGLTIRELCDRTKITRYHLENIEGDRFSALPAPVYLRGILLAVARELRLDGPKVARAYLDRAAAALGNRDR